MAKSAFKKKRRRRRKEEEEDPFHLQIGLKFQEETGKVLQLEHSFV